MHGGAELVCHTAGQHSLRAGPGRAGAVARAGDVVVTDGRCLDVEADPVQQWQQFGQAARVGAGGVQADAKAQAAHFAYGVFQRRVHGRLATAENHRIDQSDAPAQQRQHLCPLQRTSVFAGL